MAVAPRSLWGQHSTSILWTFLISSVHRVHTSVKENKSGGLCRCFCAHVEEQRSHRMFVDGAQLCTDEKRGPKKAIRSGAQQLPDASRLGTLSFIITIGR
jgi:hypothetical protein